MRVLLYGAGGFGREVIGLIDSINKQSHKFDVLGFIDDSEPLVGKQLHGLEILSMEDAASRYPGAMLACSVGRPKTRAALVDNATRHGFSFVSIVHPTVEIQDTVSIGAGSIICVGCAMTTDVEIGQHVQFNMHCTVGHDVTIGDYTTFGPGVHVAGCVHIGERVFIGGGAVISNGTQSRPIVLGNDAVVGAGSCVLKSVPAGTTVFGVPARPVPLAALHEHDQGH